MDKLKSHLTNAVAEAKDSLVLTALLAGKAKARERWLGVESLILNFVKEAWGEAEMDAEWVNQLLTLPEELKLP